MQPLGQDVEVVKFGLTGLISQPMDLSLPETGSLSHVRIVTEWLAFADQAIEIGAQNFQCFRHGSSVIFIVRHARLANQDVRV